MFVFLSFQCDKFKAPVVIKSGQTVSPFLLVFHFNQTNLHFETELYLHTNASTFNIPIYVYNGKLKVSAAFMVLISAKVKKCVKVTVRDTET